jgi:hypothetical protein
VRGLLGPWVHGSSVIKPAAARWRLLVGGRRLVVVSQAFAAGGAGWLAGGGSAFHIGFFRKYSSRPPNRRRFSYLFISMGWPASPAMSVSLRNGQARAVRAAGGTLLRRSICRFRVAFRNIRLCVGRQLGSLRKYSSPPADLAPIFISFHIHGVACIAGHECFAP